MGTSSLPSRRPTSGRKCYVIPKYSGIPKTKGDKIRSGYLTPAFSGADKWAEMLRHPYILGDPQNKGGHNQKWVPHPCLLGGPQVGGNATSSLDTRGSPKHRGTKLEVGTSPLPSRGPTSGRKCYVTPTYSGILKTKGDKIRSGYLTPAFLQADKWAEMLRHAYILGDPQNKGGQNQKWVPHPCSLKGPQVGGNATSSLDTRGSPKHRGTKSEVGTSPLPSRGPTNGRKCYVTPTYSEIPRTKGDKMRSGCLTHAFSGAHKWVEMLRHPCILEDP